MKALTKFTRTTLIGGLLVILPLYVGRTVLAKTVVRGCWDCCEPVTRSGSASVEFRQIVAIILLAAVPASSSA